MAFLGGLITAMFQRTQRRREAKDIHKLYQCLQFYNHKVIHKPLAAIKDFPKWTHDEYVWKREEVYKLVLAQLIFKLNWLMNPVPVSVGHKYMHDAARDIASYKLVIKEETEDEGGAYDDDCDEDDNTPRGVVLEGTTSAGSAVCFFPGTVYFRDQLKEMPNYPEITYNNPFLMSRMDGGIIDAAKFSLEVAKKTPLAVGHMIRHPPKGKSANVMPFTCDLGEEFPDNILHLVPNKFNKKPNFLFHYPVPKCSTLVFVTTRRVQDEELFFDYRLHPDSKIPTWYQAVDKEEDVARWQ